MKSTKLQDFITFLPACCLLLERRVKQMKQNEYVNGQKMRVLLFAWQTVQK
jgi:hypothetical protein